MTPALCTRIHQALEVLLDFFNADDKGLLKKDLHTDLYMVSFYLINCVLNIVHFFSVFPKMFNRYALFYDLLVWLWKLVIPC